MFEIGNTLREARVRRKLTLQQAEDDTKIRVKYIQAMENEDFEVMPSPAYVKGFLQTYSRYLGLDPVVMLQEYRSRFEPDEEHEPFSGGSALGRPRHHGRRNTVAFVAVVCLLVLLLVWLLGYYSPGEKSTPQLPVTPSPSLSASPSPSPSPSPKPTRKPVTFTVRAAIAASWLVVRRDGEHGKELYNAILKGGEQKTFRNDGPLYVRLGNPAAVVVASGKQPLAVPDAAGPTAWLVTRKGMVKQ